MADITKIKGNYISDIKARKSINSLYKYYGDLINGTNTQIKVLDCFHEYRDVIKDKITREVDVIIENLEPGIYVCPEYTVKFTMKTKKLSGAYDTLYTSNDSCNVIYVNNKGTLYMKFIYNNVEHTLHYSTDSVNYKLYKRPLCLNIDNNVEYTPESDYNPTPKIYVDESIKNSKKETLEVLTITDNTLNLSTNKYQTVNMEDNTTLILPTTDEDILEIHLLFDTTANMKLVLPSEVRWDSTPNIEDNKRYEFILTKYGDNWIGRCIVYN